MVKKLLIGLLLAMLLAGGITTPLLASPAVDIGAEATDRATFFNPARTVIGKDHPATVAGITTSIDIWAYSNMTSVIVGTFYTTNGDTLKCRASQAIEGTITAGSKVTKAVSIAVEIGDYIGCYWVGGAIEADLSGFAGFWYVTGEYIDPGDEAEYAVLSGDAISLGGYITPPTAPAITTNAATYVAKTTARLNSIVTDDGGEPCDVRFGYGTTTQTAANFELYDTKTAWVENTYTTGQHPYVDIASLVANTGYFYRAQIRNGHSTVTSVGEIEFTTLVDFNPPTNLKAYPGSTTVGLTWTKGVGTTNTMVRYSEVTYPANETAGTHAYTGTLGSCTITGLTSGHTYYIVAIGRDNGNYTATVEVMATTTAGAVAEDEPTDPTMPTGWFQSPDYTGLSGLPLYDQMNDLFDAFELPRASGWFLSAILGCVVIGAIVFVISRHPTPAVITLAVSLAIFSLIKLLPLYMMAFTVLFIIGVWQLGRES